MFNSTILNIAAQEKKSKDGKAWKVVDGQEKLLLRLQMDFGEVRRGRPGMQGLIYQVNES